jgi:hypothetical protein
MLGKGLAAEHYTRKSWGLAGHYTCKLMPWCQGFTLHLQIDALVPGLYPTPKTLSPLPT